MKYSKEFVDKVRTVFMDSKLAGALNVLQALENGEAKLGRLLEKFSEFQFSPEEVLEILEGKSGMELLIASQDLCQYAKLAISSQALLFEWNKIYRQQKPVKYDFSTKTI